MPEHYYGRVATRDGIGTRIEKLRAQAQGRGYGGGWMKQQDEGAGGATYPLHAAPRRGVPGRAVQSAGARVGGRGRPPTGGFGPDFSWGGLPGGLGASGTLGAKLRAGGGGGAWDGAPGLGGLEPHKGREPGQGAPPVHARDPGRFLRRDDGQKVRKGEFKPKVTKPGPPPKGPGVVLAPSAKPAPKTRFRSMYIQRDLPVKYVAGINAGIKWIDEKPDEADRSRLLPVFFDGMREYEEPYRLIAIRGSKELVPLALERGTLPETAPKVAEVLFRMLKDREPTTVAVGLEVINAVMRDDDVAAQAVLPLLKKLLPHLGFFAARRLEIDMGYGSRRFVQVQDLVQEFLERLEYVGTPEVTKMIKRSVPAYESMVTVQRALEKKRLLEYSRRNALPSAGQ